MAKTAFGARLSRASPKNRKERRATVKNGPKLFLCCSGAGIAIAADDPQHRSERSSDILFLAWRDEMGQRSLRLADATFGVLRLILEWGRDRGLISLNHATRPKKLYRGDRSDKLWLPHHLGEFRAVAPQNAPGA